ncbi:MAG: formate dehydrogenase accessory protein FdhE, partial [Chloroflexi bacterium]|nr:formate dehydrogenase accessory protein FdhE [Chloroflexota bacterium]
MPRNPISKFLDRRKPLRADAEQALNLLSQLAEQRPDLAALAATHAALLRVAFRDMPAIPQLFLDSQYARTKAAAGVPLLRGESLPLDRGWLRERYLELCAALANQPGAHVAAAQVLREAVRRGAIDVHGLTLNVLAGDPGTVADQAARADLDAGLAATLLRWTLLPLLEQVALGLQPLREQIDWQQGYCPTCGAWPILAEQRGIEQIRFLRCGLCASDWSSERLLCPFCGSRAHADIAYLYEERHEATQRAVTCERCHCYYKSIATLTPLSAPRLLVADLATVHLDLVALERAY